MNERAARKVVVKGEVSLALWDDHVETACITTPCGDEYFAWPGRIADELLGLQDLHVQASGRTWDDGQRRVIAVASFREIDPADYEVVESGRPESEPRTTRWSA